MTRGDSGRRNYPILLKFCTNAYELCEIIYTVFGVHCPKRMRIGYTRFSEYITFDGRDFFKINFDMVIIYKN